MDGTGQSVFRLGRLSIGGQQFHLDPKRISFAPNLGEGGIANDGAVQEIAVPHAPGLIEEDLVIIGSRDGGRDAIEDVVFLDRIDVLGSERSINRLRPGGGPFLEGLHADGTELLAL